MEESTIAPELYEFVKRLTLAGFRIILSPTGRVGNPIDYDVEVQADGLTPEELKQLLEMVEKTPYVGAMRNGWLELKSRY